MDFDKTPRTELKPNEEGFRYVLMWMNHILNDKRNNLATPDYIIEWRDFILDCQRELNRLREQMRGEPVAWMRHRLLSGAGGLGGGVVCEFSEHPFGGFDDPAAADKDATIEPLYATPPAAPGMDVEAFLKECEDVAAHIEQNGKSLREKFGEEHEGRCRELCAMYLREFISNYRMGQRLAAEKGAEAAGKP